MLLTVLEHLLTYSLLWAKSPVAISTIIVSHTAATLLITPITNSIHEFTVTIRILVTMYHTQVHRYTVSDTRTVCIITRRIHVIHRSTIICNPIHTLSLGHSLC